MALIPRRLPSTYLRTLPQYLGFAQDGPMPVYKDNTALNGEKKLSAAASEPNKSISASTLLTRPSRMDTSS